MKIKRFLTVSFLLALVVLSSCSKNDKKNTAHVQIALTDSPDPSVKEVWIDVQQVEIIASDSSKPILLSAAHPGVYNLLELTNGKDTLLADASIPAGKISQIRLILGDNNYIVTQDGVKLALKTPSGQTSGLKVQIHETVSGGIDYKLTLDFDVARSIVFAGNSGNILLKPVLRIISFAPSGGNIAGVVSPASFPTFVIALNGTDTVASTATNGFGNYLMKDIAAGNYTLLFVPGDSTYAPATVSTAVTLGKLTTVDTVFLHH
jgi:hypothetical protein